MKFDLFISYSRKDIATAKRVGDVLDRYQKYYKFGYFFDTQDITSRHEYLKRIADAISESKAMIFLASKNSASSEFCVKELLFADKYGCKIHQYRIDKSALPNDIELLLGNHQYREKSITPIEELVREVLSDVLGCEIKTLAELEGEKTQPVLPKPKKNKKIGWAIILIVAALAIIGVSIWLAVEALQFELLITKAESGDVEAQYELADLYYYGVNDEEPDYIRAVVWYREAAEQGHYKAQLYLALCYYAGKGVTQDYTEAARWYRKAAEQGGDLAQYNLGECYYKGEGVKKDYTEAAKWYRKAAEQGLVDAQYNLGNSYYNGEGVSQDYTEAVKWYRKAAEQGYINAQLYLGFCYYNGKGVAKDDIEAVKWFSEAAKNNDTYAQYSLGICYYNGKGVTKDYDEAVRWYSMAAERGFADAQYNLGFCYYNGEGVIKNYFEAEMWWRKAAEQGHADAQYTLGVCYYNGEDVTKDDAEAAKWCRKAAEQGHEQAKQLLEMLEKENSSK